MRCCCVELIIKDATTEPKLGVWHRNLLIVAPPPTYRISISERSLRNRFSPQLKYKWRSDEETTWWSPVEAISDPAALSSFVA